jgi:putative transposase
MSRFRKLSHALWHCQYHLVWVPKYRFRILTGDVGIEVGGCIRTFCEQLKCELMEMNVQNDHVHLLVMIPPKISVSDFVGTVKGRTAIRVFNKFRHLKQKPYWGNHFWTKGYCADTVGLDEEKIRKYVKYQEAKERKAEHQQQNLF